MNHLRNSPNQYRRFKIYPHEFLSFYILSPSSIPSLTTLICANSRMATVKDYQYKEKTLFATVYLYKYFCNSLAQKQKHCAHQVNQLPKFTNIISSYATSCPRLRRSLTSKQSTRAGAPDLDLFTPSPYLFVLYR